jgi:hypothetical protein
VLPLSLASAGRVSTVLERPDELAVDDVERDGVSAGSQVLDQHLPSVGGEGASSVLQKWSQPVNGAVLDGQRR